MNMQVKARVMEASRSEKGDIYVNMFDVETGGQLNMALPINEIPKPDTLIDVTMEVQPRRFGKNQYFKVLKMQSNGGK